MCKNIIYSLYIISFFYYYYSLVKLGKLKIISGTVCNGQYSELDIVCDVVQWPVVPLNDLFIINS